jgi:large subunit ribosomal protein LP2
MKHLAAYLLLALAGNESPSAADVKGVLSSVGIDADTDRLEKLIAELQGKDLQEVSFFFPVLGVYRTLLTGSTADR